MIHTIFLQIVNMSVKASIVIGFVLLIRLFLKRAPKVFSYILWSAVLFRLLIPVSFESVISLLPEKNSSLSVDIISLQTSADNREMQSVNGSVRSDLFKPVIEKETKTIPSDQLLVSIGIVIWLIGAAGLMGYNILSLMKLKIKLKDSIHDCDNIYLSKLRYPFVMGVIRPKIYLPEMLGKGERQYILLHEQYHIKRFDHIIKIMSFLALCLHWFNPLAWVAFYLSNKDMEMSCDEKVICILGNQIKKEYSSSLLALATGRKNIGGTSLAFGEGNTKERIKNVLYYKKPSFWVLIIAFLVVLGMSIALAADPTSKSFLHPDRICSAVMNREEPIRIAEYNYSIYQYLKGEVIGNWVKKTVWKKQKGSYISELSPTYVIENIYDVGVQSEIRLYEEEPELAIIVYGDKQQIYQIDETAYERLEAMILPISYAEPFQNRVTAAVVTEYDKGEEISQVKILDLDEVNRLYTLLSTRDAGENDTIKNISAQGTYTQIAFQTPKELAYYCIYENDGKYYSEIPDQEIWEISYDIAEEIKKIVYNKSIQDLLNEVSQMEKTLTEKFEAMIEEPLLSSNPYDYIKANQEIFDEIVSYGNSTLVYCYQLFEQGQTGLKGQLMMYACRVIQAENEDRLGYENGQLWYEAVKKEALELKEKNSMHWIQENYPSYFILLNLLEWE